MRDKDTLMLESLYCLIAEGLSETEKKLKSLNIDDEDVKKLIEVDITKQKSDAIKLGEYLSSSNLSIDQIINLYKEFVKFKNKGAAETRDFQGFKSLKDLEKVLAKLNSEEAQKILKDSDETKRLLNLDKSLGKRDSGIIVKWIKELKGRFPNSEVIGGYEKFLEYKEQNVEGSSDLGLYNRFFDFAEFIHNQEAKNATEEESQNIKVGVDAIYEDKEIAIWDIDNVGKSINIGHAVSKRLGGTQITWCISYPLNSGLTNYFSSYRQGKVGSQQPLSFYFVLDKKKDNTNPYVWSAVARRKDGEFEITPRPNGTARKEWEEIVNLIPSIKNHKQFFVYKPLSESEVKKMNFFDRLGRSFDEEAFLQMDDKDQYEFISMGQDIPVSAFLRLSKERKNDYLNILAQSQTRDPSKKLLKVLTPEQTDRIESTKYRAIEYKLTGVDAPLEL